MLAKIGFNTVMGLGQVRSHHEFSLFDSLIHNQVFNSASTLT